VHRVERAERTREARAERDDLRPEVQAVPQQARAREALPLVAEEERREVLECRTQVQPAAALPLGRHLDRAAPARKGGEARRLVGTARGDRGVADDILARFERQVVRRCGAVHGLPAEEGPMRHDRVHGADLFQAHEIPWMQRESSLFGRCAETPIVRRDHEDASRQDRQDQRRLEAHAGVVQLPFPRRIREEAGGSVQREPGPRPARDGSLQRDEARGHGAAVATRTLRSRWVPVSAAPATSYRCPG
jgi:hypothetical protein